MSVLLALVECFPRFGVILRRFDKNTQRAVVQNFNLAMLLVAVSMIIPVFIGHRLYTYISEALFRKIVLTLLTTSGAALLVSSLARLIS